jgi:hypothetical protein
VGLTKLIMQWMMMALEMIILRRFQKSFLIFLIQPLSIFYLTPFDFVFQILLRRKML